MGCHILPYSVLSVALLSAIGCFGEPDIAKPPTISPSEAGEQAMKLYDSNGDGAIAGDELSKAPALIAAMKSLDQDGDGRITANEIAARVEKWQARGLASIPVSVQVTLDNRPLGGAKITFEPEPFLGDEIQAGVGTTRAGGTAYVSIPRENRSDPSSPAGMYFGLYKIRVSKIEGGIETIPAKYNTETTLGQEIAMDSQGMQGGIQLRLKSR